MICKECGAHIDDNVSVCPFCGAVYDENGNVPQQEETTASEQEAPVQAADAQPESVPEEADISGPEEAEDDGYDADELFDENEIKRRRQMERMRAEKQSQLEEIERRRQEKRRRQKRNKIIIVSIIIVCVAAAAAAGIYTFRNKDDGNVVLSTEEPSETAAATATLPVITPAASVSPAPAATEAVSWQSTGGSESGGSTSGGRTSSSGGSTGSGRTSGSSAGSSSSRGGSSSSSNSGGGSSSGSTSSGGSSSGGTSGLTTSYATFGGSYSAEGGMSDGRFTAALVTGGEIVSGSGRTYMTFTYNGNTYYANASADSYTSYIQGRPMTLSAFPTSEVYNGNTVYEITDITHYTGDYIFPNSGFRLLNESDLAGKSKEILALGRNEIYARHGRQFQMQEFSSYFSRCSWYSIDPNYNYEDDASNLNSIERANVNLIKEHEDRMN